MKPYGRSAPAWSGHEFFGASLRVTSDDSPHKSSRLPQLIGHARGENARETSQNLIRDVGNTLPGKSTHPQRAATCRDGIPSHWCCSASGVRSGWGLFHCFMRVSHPLVAACSVCATSCGIDAQRCGCVGLPLNRLLMRGCAGPALPHGGS